MQKLQLRSARGQTQRANVQLRWRLARCPSRLARSEVQITFRVRFADRVRAVESSDRSADPARFGNGCRGLSPASCAQFAAPPRERVAYAARAAGALGPKSKRQDDSMSHQQTAPYR